MSYISRPTGSRSQAIAIQSASPSFRFASHRVADLFWAASVRLLTSAVIGMQLSHEELREISLYFFDNAFQFFSYVSVLAMILLLYLSTFQVRACFEFCSDQRISSHNAGFLKSFVVIAFNDDNGQFFQGPGQKKTGKECSCTIKESGLFGNAAAPSTSLRTDSGWVTTRN